MSSLDFNDFLNNQKRFTDSKSIKKKKQLLTKEQEKILNERLDRSKAKFQKAINAKDLKEAKTIMVDLQQILRAMAKTIKLVEVKNKLFELAIENGEFDLAISGFESNRTLLNPKTKLYLETTALLAISYLRKKEIEKAKPCIKEVLQSSDVIKTPGTKEKFNEEIIKRFDEECILASLQSESRIQINQDELTKEVDMALTLTEDQLFTMLSKVAPQEIKQILFDVDKYSKNQLTYKEQLLLPSTEDVIKDESVGRTLFSSLKRVVYNSLCSKESEVYKMVFTNGLSKIDGKKVIIAAVASSVVGIGITATTIITFVAAIIIRFGLDIYCEHYKPSDITSLRRKSK